MKLEIEMGPRVKEKSKTQCYKEDKLASHCETGTWQIQTSYLRLTGRQKDRQVSLVLALFWSLWGFKMMIEHTVSGAGSHSSAAGTSCISVSFGRSSSTVCEDVLLVDLEGGELGEGWRRWFLGICLSFFFLLVWVQLPNTQTHTHKHTHTSNTRLWGPCWLLKLLRYLDSCPHCRSGVDSAGPAATQYQLTTPPTG